MSYAKIHIGTSGWSYDDWYDNFYPIDINNDELLQFYSRHFSTVEINTSFYHLIKEKTYQNWHKDTPKDFIFSVKASRYITHIKRLKDPKDSWIKFEKGIRALKNKLGVILFQFPANFKVNQERLANYLKFLPQKYKYAFEFRHKSWFNNEVYEILNKYNSALCLVSAPDYPWQEKITADFTYLRLHGAQELYKSKYSNQELKNWADKIKNWQEQDIEVYCYFDNAYEANAIDNAKQLIELVK